MTILHAATDDGGSLPIIDLTNPAFAIAIGDAEAARLAEQFVREQSARPPMTPEIIAALEKSRLGKALLAASGTFLSGLATYTLKLGVEHLGADAGPIDQRIAASYPAVALRIRLRDLARLLATALEPKLRSAPGAPLHLINIAGGPSADSWNALLILNAAYPKLLQGRAITITVFDQDASGPAFGRRAVEALRAPGAPLAGLAIELRAVEYRWREPEILARELAAMKLAGAVHAVSTEGGLFDYGDDATIAANLRVLRDALGPAATVAGSMTNDCEATRATRRERGAAVVPRTLDAFVALIRPAGFIATQILPRPLTYHLSLAAV